MKKILTVCLVALAAMSLFAGGSGESTDTDSNVIENLRIMYVPSREPEEIITATEPLKELLTQELAAQGYTVENIDISVGQTMKLSVLLLQQAVQMFPSACRQIPICSMIRDVM